MRIMAVITDANIRKRDSSTRILEFFITRRNEVNDICFTVAKLAAYLAGPH